MDMNMETFIGHFTVKFVHHKGFAFLESEEMFDDVFVSITLTNAARLKEGESVVACYGRNEQGFLAVKVARSESELKTLLQKRSQHTVRRTGKTKPDARKKNLARKKAMADKERARRIALKGSENGKKKKQVA